MPSLTDMGFDLTDLGGGDYAVNGMPSGLDGISLPTLVQELVEAAVELGQFSADSIHHTLALGLARNAAVPYGQVMGNDEMENIVNGLFACDNVNYTPDGRPILGILPQHDIEHLFN